MSRSSRIARLVVASAVVGAILLLGGVIANGSVAAFSGDDNDNPGACESQSVDKPGPECTAALKELFEQGKQVFRFDTFGDEDFWGGQLQLHKAIAGAAQGGVGPGVSPKTALTAAGLKVDVDALPKNLIAALKAGKVDLDSPATTLALLKLNAVVGVKGFFDSGGSLASIGITCAICHSTVDDSFAPGIGSRLDGWPNQDLDTGLIVSLAPNLAPMAQQVLGSSSPAAIDTLKKVLLSWGPGFYDAEVNIDAIGFKQDADGNTLIGPDGKPESAATRIPAAYGHLGENFHTWTGYFGNVTYWNAYVANLQMHGNGNFNDSRFEFKLPNGENKYPAAIRGSFNRLRHDPDEVTSKLAPLHYYQLSLKAPTPPDGSFDPAAAKRGEQVFNGQGECSDCHMPPLHTDAGYNAHTPEEICLRNSKGEIDTFQADRGPRGLNPGVLVTPQLNGLWARSKRGFYHDGRYGTLLDVINHYDSCFGLGLSSGQKSDLVEFLKSN
jgi:mono/diheme cytochrome c family protein